MKYTDCTDLSEAFVTLVSGEDRTLCILYREPHKMNRVVRVMRTFPKYVPQSAPEVCAHQVLSLQDGMYELRLTNSRYEDPAILIPVVQ